ncbi:hypothetical protein AYI70_g4629 [Smittium culicis]|uniref:Magnesium transport protein CorA n=1 Tax=Smittium culicis TaxID=133412 RepID=A0A1R1XYI6_9FUNG|nr:hypothetical protein AYI70_g4629 [Smittium culicis]
MPLLINDDQRIQVITPGNCISLLPDLLHSPISIHNNVSENIKYCIQSNSSIWVDIIGPTEEEMFHISQLFDLPRLSEDSSNFDGINISDAIHFNKNCLHFELVSVYGSLHPVFSDLNSLVSANNHDPLAEKPKSINSLNFNSDKLDEKNTHNIDQRQDDQNHALVFTPTDNLAATIFILQDNVLITIRPAAIKHMRVEVSSKLHRIPESRNPKNEDPLKIYSTEYLLFLLIDGIIKSFENSVLMFLEKEVEEAADSVMNGLEFSRNTFYKNFFYLRQVIHYSHRNTRKKPAILKLILKNLETRLDNLPNNLDHLCGMLATSTNKPDSSTTALVGDNQISSIKTEISSQVQSSVYGLSSLVYDCSHITAVCIHSDSMISQLYDQFLDMLVISSEFDRLEFSWFLMKWYRIYVFCTIPSIFFNMFGMNVLVPYDYGKGIEYLMAKNKNCVQFYTICAVCSAIIITTIVIYFKKSSFKFYD